MENSEKILEVEQTLDGHKVIRHPERPVWIFKYIPSKPLSIDVTHEYLGTGQSGAVFDQRDYDISVHVTNSTICVFLRDKEKK